MTARRRQRRARGVSRWCEKAASAALAGLAMAALAGCGQKGPLVLPDGAAAGGSTGAASSGASDDQRAADEDEDGTESRDDGR